MVWLERLDIAAFGGISGKSYSFTRGVNLITAANECGKSTLIAAIRFGLYGFTSTQHSITDNPKKKYMPWNGAAASVTLTLGGDKRVRIERSVYGNKETALCTELATGLPLYAGKVFGEELLGISADTADKTLFFATVNPHLAKDEPLAESLQGLVFSADERVGGDKAVKTLNTHKNALSGKNGTIPKLELEVQQLEEKQATAQTAVAELSALESDIKRVSAALEEKERAAEQAEEERAGLKRYRAAQTLEEYRTAADRQKAASAALSAFGNPNLSMEHIQLCNSLNGQAAESAARINTLRTQLIQAEAEAAEDDERDLPTLAARCGAKRKWALVLAVVAVLLIGAGVALYMAAIPLGAVALLVAGAACAVGALGFAMNSANTVKAAGYTGLSPLIAAAKDGGVEQQDREARIAAIKASIAKEQAQHTALLARIKETGADGDTGAMMKELLTLNELRSESSAATAALAAMESRYDIAELERLAAGAVKPQKSEEQMETEYRFATQGARMLREKLQPMLARREALRLATATLGDTEERLAWCNTKLSAAKSTHAALLLAMEELEAAGDQMKSSIAPRIAGYASAHLATATAGRYPALELDTRLYPAVDSENGVKSAEYLSTGTRDVLYLAMRLGYLQLIYGTDSVPLFLDDAFCRTDGARLSAMLSTLCASGNQLFITSCTDREAKALSAIGAECNHIKL